MGVKARVMGEEEEVQEKVKADMEAMKEKMAAMMEAMMRMKKIMEANAVAIAATSTVAKVTPRTQPNPSPLVAPRAQQPPAVARHQDTPTQP